MKTRNSLPAPLPPDTGSPETDHAALIALYNATDGENWTNNTNWLTDKPLAEWHGVNTYHDNGRVHRLGLGSNQLSGPIPPELGNLTNLEWLRLGNNQLTGCVLTALQSVSNNDFADLNLPFCAQ